MKLSDAATMAQVVLINDVMADWICDGGEGEDGEPTVSIRQTEHDEDYEFEDVEIDLAKQNWIELMPIDPVDHEPGELVRIEFYMLRPMTVADFTEE